MNDHKIRQINAEAGHRKFIQALSAGQANALDRFNQTMKPGQRVLFHNPVDLVFEVSAIAPVLDPGAPPGLMNVTLAATITVPMPANQANQAMMILPFLGAAPMGPTAQGDGDHGPTESGEGDEAGVGSEDDSDRP